MTDPCHRPSFARRLRIALWCFRRVMRDEPTGTITFPAGDYEIPGVLVLEGNIALLLESPATLICEGATWKGEAPCLGPAFVGVAREGS